MFSHNVQEAIDSIFVDLTVTHNVLVRKNESLTL